MLLVSVPKNAVEMYLSIPEFAELKTNLQAKLTTSVTTLTSTIYTLHSNKDNIASHPIYQTIQAYCRASKQSEAINHIVILNVLYKHLDKHLHGYQEIEIDGKPTIVAVKNLETQIMAQEIADLIWDLIILIEKYIPNPQAPHKSLPTEVPKLLPTLEPLFDCILKTPYLQNALKVCRIDNPMTQLRRLDSKSSILLQLKSWHAHAADKRVTAYRSLPAYHTSLVGQAYMQPYESQPIQLYCKDIIAMCFNYFSLSEVKECYLSTLFMRLENIDGSYEATTLREWEKVDASYIINGNPFFNTPAQQSLHTLYTKLPESTNDTYRQEVNRALEHLRAFLNDNDVVNRPIQDFILKHAHQNGLFSILNAFYEYIYSIYTGSTLDFKLWESPHRDFIVKSIAPNKIKVVIEYYIHLKSAGSKDASEQFEFKQFCLRLKCTFTIEAKNEEIHCLEPRYYIYCANYFHPHLAQFKSEFEAFIAKEVANFLPTSRLTN